MFTFAQTPKVLGAIYRSYPSEREIMFVTFQLTKGAVLRTASSTVMAVVLSYLAVVGVTGCGTRVSDAVLPPTQGTQTIQGRVYGGQQPVAGATIQLYAAGAPPSGGGFGQGSRPLISGPLPTTDSNGAFTITGDYPALSTPGYFYIVSSGGSPGKGNPANPNIVMIAALNNCTATTTLSSSLFININEVTTVASISALQTFIAAPTPGNVGAPAIGAPAAAYNDLRNAFEMASNLVPISTGAVSTQAGSNGPLINTLADILAYCVNSDPSSTSNCSTLFADATPTGVTPIAADITQAAWYIAQNPTNELAALFALVTPNPPFPALSAPPANFNVSLPPTAAVACFAILGASAISSAGATIVSGADLGLYPGTSVTGFPPGTITSPAAQHITDSVAQNAQEDLSNAYTYAAGLLGATVLPDDMSGLILSPGLYSSSTAQLSTNMTLNALGNTNAVFIFQIGSTLTTAPDTQVILLNGAQAQNVFWQVGTSATLGTNSTFEGTIMAHASITVGTGATVHGRALASTAAVTLDSNTVTAP